MTEHTLKTWPAHFADLWSGAKTAELRRDDRAFAVGDVLRLREWCPDLYADARDDGSTDAEADRFAASGRAILARVTHVLRGAPWLAEGYAMLSLEVVTREDTK